METLKTKTTLSASELRIGNIALNPNTKKPCVITVMDISDIENGYKERLGVELSPDILLSAGFEIHSKNSFWTFILPNKWSISMWMEDEPCAGFEKKGVCYYGENYVEVKHLHQLQNLYFALTNCELTITLNQ